MFFKRSLDFIKKEKKKIGEKLFEKIRLKEFISNSFKSI